MLIVEDLTMTEMRNNNSSHSHSEIFNYEHALIAVPYLSHCEIFNYKHALIAVPHLTVIVRSSIFEALTMTVR
jgi:hypothetical protein